MNLIERVKNIILTPVSEWAVIEHERGDASYLFTNYVAILAAIPAICGFVGMSLIGITVPGLGTLRVPIASGLVSTFVGYLLTFAMVYVVALLVDVLAPTFKGQRNFDNALKLTVYSCTPVWLAGIFVLIPALSFLSILGLYGLYLMLTGIRPMMKAPEDKAVVYTVSIVLCVFVISLVIGLIQVAITPLPRA